MIQEDRNEEAIFERYQSSFDQDFKLQVQSFAKWENANLTELQIYPKIFESFRFSALIIWSACLF